MQGSDASSSNWVLWRFSVGHVGVTESAGPAVGAIGEALQFPAVVSDYVVMTA